LKPKIRLMVDSGAYSSWTQNKPISLPEYTEFVLKNQEVIDSVVNLDVIQPGSPETAAAAGRENFLKMREAGVISLPVFHARESLKWFDLMLEECPYIGISATSLVSPREQQSFLDLAFHYGTDSKGYPIAKYHAFGDTAPKSLLSYPWFSCDSATWMISGCRAGSVKLKGKTYRLRSKVVSDTNYISDHDALPQKEAWQNEFRMLGLDPDAVMSVKTTPSQLAMIRSYLVASDILKLQEQTRGVTRFKKPGALIINKKQEAGGIEREGPIRVIFVISPSAAFMNFPVICALGIKDILASYFYIAKEKPRFWHERLVPFLHDPMAFIKSDMKMSAFYSKLQEVLLKKESTILV
jgi:hypothetical protein